MLVYLIRHGIAVERGTPGISEMERPLTQDGLRRMRQNARGLHRLGLEIDAIWTSPLTRARQTADILGTEFSLTAAIREEASLEPDSTPAKVIEQLRKAPKKARIALVGHEPQLGLLATYLLCGLGSSAVEFKKGGAACIEVDSFRRPIRGHLRWLLTPRHLRSIRKSK